MEPREFLAIRDNWQANANKDGSASERGFHSMMKSMFQIPAFSVYKITDKPSNLKALYGTPEQQKKWGIKPDASIANTKTGRTVFVEVKRQNPRGNAHERACKYFAPGIVAAGRRAGKIGEDDFPFFMVFTNGLKSDERYASEIAFWFSDPKNPKMKDHFLLWDFDPGALWEFFHKKIRPVIDKSH